jgi:HK97 family phage major capsid protein
MTPKRNTAKTIYDVGFLRQSTVDAEAFVRDDLGFSLSEGVDSAIYNGSGVAPIPEGIIPQLGVGQETAWDATKAWAKIVAMETAVESANALAGSLRYVTTPGIKGLLKTTPRLANTIALPIWGDDNAMNGYPALSSTNVPKNLGTNTDEHALLFGDFSQVILGEWGALEIIVDPYTRADYGEYVINAHLLADIAIRHIEAFNLMTGIKP